MLGEDEKHRKTIGVRILHQHVYNPGPGGGVYGKGGLGRRSLRGGGVRGGGFRKGVFRGRGWGGRGKPEETHWSGNVTPIWE